MDDAALDDAIDDLHYDHRDSDSSYRIVLERRGAVLAISLSGNLLTPAPETFVEMVAGVLAKLNKRGVVVDMSACEYLSSSAISHLIRYADAAQRGGCKVAMVAPQPKVKVVLDLLGLNSVCPILADEPAARAWFVEQGLPG